jgi:hypothetical protein
MSSEYVNGNAEEDGRENKLRGWFVGHFLSPESGLRRNSGVEVKWGVHTANERKRSVRTNLESTTLTLLVSGDFEVTFPKIDVVVNLTRPGDYVLFAPGLDHEWVARTPSVVVTVRWPSVPQCACTENELETGRQLLADICASHAASDSDIMQGVAGEQEHALDVLGWVQKLRPDAGLPLCLAALFHDLDRIVTPKAGGGFKGDRSGPEYAAYKKQHAARSAAFIAPLLLNRGISSDIVDRTIFLILHHDDTGEEVAALSDAELDCLVAADTFAFFTSIGPKLYAAEGEARLRDKIRFMVGKLPDNSRQLLRKHRLSNEIFDRLKNDAAAQYDSEHLTNPMDMARGSSL